MLRVTLDKKAVYQNVSALSEYLKVFGCDFSVVTKSLKLDRTVLTEIGLPHLMMFDTKEENIQVLREFGADITVNSHQYSGHKAEKRVIISDLESLKKDFGNRTLLLNFELGDKREGIELNKLEETINILKDIGVKSVEIMSNIGCLYRDKPDKNYF
jgi:predicted amino acid racemase